jgi:cell division protein FtsI (penicillin-binding protein 3)
LQVSPLHTLTLYNAVANEGVMMKPYLVSSVRQDGIVTRQYKPEVLEQRIAGPEVIKGAKESMEAVITEGTGRPAFKNMPFMVAGKTGTAHVADASIKYHDMVYQASFVGYFPANNPQYSCIVVIRTRPHAAQHYGGQLAAPVFREVATKLYAMYVDKKVPALYAARKDSSAYFFAGNTNDIRKIYTAMKMGFTDSASQGEWGSVYGAVNGAVIKTNAVNKKLVPNVRGMGLKDALFLLESLGMKVTVRGRGKVTSQSVPPGSVLQKGSQVVLDLS